MRVESHLHITRALSGNKNCISYRPLPGGSVAYASALHLSRASFAVQPAGLRRFRETGLKNVHAYVRGSLENYEHDRWPENIDVDWRRARYNPKDTDTFVDAELGYAVHRANEALLIGTSVYYR